MRGWKILVARTALSATVTGIAVGGDLAVHGGAMRWGLAASIFSVLWMFFWVIGAFDAIE